MSLINITNELIVSNVKESIDFYKIYDNRNGGNNEENWK